MASKKSDRQIKEANRSKALELLDARGLLEVVETVGQAAYEWEEAEKLAEQKAENYRQAWAAALDNSWKAEQLDQLPTVNARPPRKRSGAAKSTTSTPKTTTTASPAQTSPNGEQVATSNGQSEQPVEDSPGHAMQ